MLRKFVSRLLGQPDIVTDDALSKIEYQNLDYDIAFQLAVSDRKSRTNLLYFQFMCDTVDFRSRHFEVYIDDEKVNQYVLNRPDHEFLIPLRNPGVQINIRLLFEQFQEDGDTVAEKIALSELAIYSDRMLVGPSTVGLEIDSSGGICPPYTEHCREDMTDSSVVITPQIIEKIIPVCNNAQDVTLFISKDPAVLPVIQRILDEIDTTQVMIHICADGVPSHPPLVEYLIQKKVRYLEILLNSDITKPSRKRDRLIFDETQAGLVAITALKNKQGAELPHLQLNMIYTRKNLKSLSRFVMLGHETSAQKLMLQTVYPLDFLNTPSSDPHENEPVDRSNSRAVEKSEASFRKKFQKAVTEAESVNIPLEFADTGYAPCVRPWQSVHVSMDGYTSPCSFTFCPETSAGNLTENTFEHIWNNDYTQEMRRNMATRQLPPQCLDCVYYNRNNVKFYYNQR